MKNNFFLSLSLIFLLSIYELFAVQIDGSKTIVGFQINKQNNNYTFVAGGDGYNIGLNDGPLYAMYDRTKYTFDLTSIPTNATLTSVILFYTTSDEIYTFNITEISNITGLEALFNTIGQSSQLFSDVNSGSSSLSSSTLTTLVNSNRGGYIYLGAYSNAEDSPGSGEIVNLQLGITYTIPITTDNNFIDNSGNGTHGSIKVDGNTRTAPYTFPKAIGNNVTLEAISPQTDNTGYQEIWNTSSCDPSQWTGSGGSFKSNNQTYSFTVSSSDNNVTYMANFHQNRVTTSGTMSSSENWISNVTLAGNISVPSGVTLTITSCAAVNFGQYGILLNGGTIDYQSNFTGTYLKQDGTLKGYFGSIQPAINNASSGQSIELLSTAYNESPSFSGKSNIALYGQGQGSTTLNGSIFVTNSSYITISDLTMSSALSANNSNWTSFNNATITGPTIASNYGGTYTQVGYVTADNIGASFGLNSYGGSGDLYYSTVSNGDCAVFLSNSASYNIGTNNTFCSNGFDIYAQYGAYAYAISNDYSRSLPETIYGNVFVTGQNGVCSQPKALAVNNEKPVEQIPPELKALDEKYLALLRKIHEAKENKKYDAKNYVQDYLQLISDYKNLINAGKDKAVMKAALSKISQLYRGMDDKEGFENYITETMATGKIKSLEPYLKRYLIWNFVDDRQLDNALKTADEVMTSQDATEDLHAEMLYEKGLIYKYYLNDNNKSKEMYASILSKYPESPLTIFAAKEMGITPDYSFKNSSSESNQNIIVASNELKNYPNPFNPTTMITYSLKGKDHITLVVFDILGKEVASLVDGMQTEGEHSVSFNGSNLPSGMYIYQLKGSNFNLSRKMLLLK